MHPRHAPDESPKTKRVPRTLVSFGYLPILVVATFMCDQMLKRGVPPVAPSGPLILGFTIVIAILERVYPYRPDWTPNLSLLGLDLVHSTVDPSVAALARSGLYSMATIIGASAVGHGLLIWPEHWHRCFNFA